MEFYTNLLVVLILASVSFSLLKSNRAKKESYQSDIVKRFGEALFCQLITLVCTVLFTLILFDAIYGNTVVYNELLEKNVPMNAFEKILNASMLPLAFARTIRLIGRVKEAKKNSIQ